MKTYIGFLFLFILLACQPQNKSNIKVSGKGKGIRVTQTGPDNSNISNIEAENQDTIIVDQRRVQKTENEKKSSDHLENMSFIAGIAASVISILDTLLKRKP